MDPANAAQSRIDALIASLRSQAVGRVEIVQIPPRVLTRTRVTPEMLERSFHYKLIIRDMRGGAHYPEVLAVLTSTHVKPTVDMGDLRWGVTFFDSAETRIVSLYLDGAGDRGAVDSVAVSFEGALNQWLNANFSKAFK